MTDLIGFREMVPRGTVYCHWCCFRGKWIFGDPPVHEIVVVIVGSGRHLIEIENLMLVLIQLIRVVLFSKQLTLSHDWRAIALMS